MGAEKKPKAEEAMKRAGLTHARLAEELGWNWWDVSHAFDQRLDPERAGEFVRTLGTFTHLTTKERREIFREVVNSPGKKDEPLFSRISTEDPFEDLNEASCRMGITDYRNGERDARDLFGTPPEEDS
jgi:hypothetical protein